MIDDISRAGASRIPGRWTRLCLLKIPPGFGAADSARLGKIREQHGQYQECDQGDQNSENIFRLIALFQNYSGQVYSPEG